MDQLDAFQAQLLAAFRMESEEHFDAISGGLVDLERLPPGDERRTRLETVYRAFHSLKGASRAVDLREIEGVCQSAETVFAAAKRDDFPLTAVTLDVIHGAVDAMRSSLVSRNQNTPAILTGFQERLETLIQERRTAANGGERTQPVAVAAGAPPANGRERISPAPMEGPRIRVTGPLIVTERKPDAAAMPVTERKPDAAATSSAPAAQEPPAPPQAQETATRIAPSEPCGAAASGPVRVQTPFIPAPPRQSAALPAFAEPARDDTLPTSAEAARSDTLPVFAEPERRAVPPASVEAAQSDLPPAFVEPDRNGAPSTPVEPAHAAPPPGRHAEGAAAPPVETIKVSSDRLDRVLLQVEELLSVKLAAGHRAARMRQLEATVIRALGLSQALSSEAGRFLRSGSASEAGGNATAKLQDMLARNVEVLKQTASEITELSRAADGDARQLDGQVDQLLEDSKTLLMLPIGSILQSLPKMARDLSRQLDKEVAIEVQGGETEIDKRILDRLKDPILHTVRNCIDHGIEMPDVRERLGKPRRGVVTLTITPLDDGKVELRIADDGGGIDPERLKQAALKQGMVSPDALETMNDDAALHLLFQSGVSTSPIITDLSGRGLGMAIVRDTLEELGGSVSVESVAGRGAAFRLMLPVSHTTLRCVLTRVSERTFLVPVTHVEHVCRVAKGEVRLVANSRAITLDGRPISVVPLADALGLPKTPSHETHLQMLVVGFAGVRIAFQVDEILYEQETLVKKLGSHLAHVWHVAGAAIMGTGEAVPILNVRELLATAQTLSANSAREPEREEAARPPARKRILVVEDSITSRMLIKNILEALGYTVSVAVDGLEALSALKDSTFDLVISDVEMPRMDGFTLTESLRKDPLLADLPVILVTSLESREHRERGVAAGANAYIVKRTFDQSNLVETIHRLI
jgi:two-component system chemotaxis sensor kinase CheA